MFIGLGLSITGQRFGGSPFASLMSTLLSGASQLIAHPLEYGSMFIDRAGTTPVTESGQLVGLALDHGFTGSKPVAGPELVTNGTFDIDTTGWTAASSAVLSVSSGSMVVTNGATAFGYAYQAVPTTVGQNYTVLFSVTGGTSTGSLFIGTTIGGFENYNSPSRGVGNYTVRFIATATTTYLRLGLTQSASGATVQFDNISVRELPGYHATAISDAARGVFREVDGIRYIEYNGVNTAYSTAALPAPLVDKAQVFAGVFAPNLTSAGSADIGILMERGGTGFNAITLQVPSTINGRVRFTHAGDTHVVFAEELGISAPLTTTITGLSDLSAPLAQLRRNSVQTAQNTGATGGGTVSQSPLYFGGQGGTVRFFNGRHYGTLGPITRFSAANATADQIAAAEAYYTKETGL